MGGSSGAGWVVFFILLTAVAALLGWWGSWAAQGKDRRFRREQALRMEMLRRRGFFPEKSYIRQRQMTPTRSIPYEYLMFDFAHGLFALENRTMDGAICYEVFSLSKVYEVQLINESSVVQSASSRHGGGLLLGVAVPGIGGFAGGSSSQSEEQTAMLSVRVQMDDPRHPAVVIPFLFGVVARASAVYGNAAASAYEVYGIFESAIRQQKLAAQPATRSTIPPPPPPPKPCEKCGQAPSPGAAFCSSCGAALK